MINQFILTRSGCVKDLYKVRSFLYDVYARKTIFLQVKYGESKDVVSTVTKKIIMVRTYMICSIHLIISHS